MCLLINEIYKTYETDFLFSCLGHAAGLELGGAEGLKIKFSEFSHMSYQIKEDVQ